MHVELGVAGLADDGFGGALAVGGALGQGGDGSLRSSAVLMSAETCQRRSISGTLVNRANRVFCRKLSPPSGAISIWLTVSPKVAAQVSKSAIPAASRRSGRR